MKPLLLIKSTATTAPKPKAKPAPKAKPGAAPVADLESPDFRGLLALIKKFKGGAEFGAHNVQEGDQIAFSAGQFDGTGKVLASGEHGATVADGASREHRVHWHEVTGHKPGKGGAEPAVKEASKK
ncbi:hypothetical protein LXA47_19395 [Massilia sp. P8910]|uniref:hypothetical protein n=1 Tax=Massilia antarctica TaxID=2765360 RepID=UPI001E5587B2|nr:hypothetical protein [Massilia antarctica]MCE3605753.1 hypothetical protein [Massilia antarctica]